MIDGILDLTLISLTHIYIIDGILDLAQAHTPKDAINNVYMC
jgi:hypothetical protein